MNKLSTLCQGARRRLYSFVVLLVILLMPVLALASHFRGGNIKWERIPGQPYQIKYTVTEAWRTSAFFGSVPAVGTTVTTGSFFPGSGSSFVNVNLVVTSVNTTEDWFAGSYTYTHTFPSSPAVATYIAYEETCCRISGLSNNNGGNFRVETKVTVGNSNDGPVSSVPPFISLPRNTTAATYQVPATDPNGDALTYSLTPAGSFGGSTTQPSGLSISSTGLLTFNTNGMTVGQLWSTSVTITDSKGATTMVDLMIKIANASTPPVYDYTVTPANNFNYLVQPGQTVSFNVKASDVDAGDVVTISAVGLPSGASYTPGSGNPVTRAFSWTPTVSQLGTFLINFTAQDNVGIQTSTIVRITVSLKPTFITPSLANNSFLCLTPGVQRIDTFKASDPDAADRVVLSAVSGVLSGMSFSPSLPTTQANPGSTIFSWTPTAAQWGIKRLVLRATDTYSETADDTVYYIVNNPPTFTTTQGNTTIFPGQLFSYTFGTSDANIAQGDVVDTTHIHLPSWISIVNNGNGTFTLSGTPSLANAGTHSVTLNIEDDANHIGGTHCGQATQNFIITVQPCTTPTAFNVTGGGGYCIGGAGSAVGLSNSQTGVNYQLYLGANPVGSPVAGTGSGISFNNQTVAGTYTVVATSTAGSCTANMSGSVNVSINSLPVVTVNSTTPYCVRDTIKLFTTPPGGTYAWTGANSFTSTDQNPVILNATQAMAGTYNVTVTDGNGCSASGNTTIVVNPLPTPAASSNTPLCAGATLNLSATGGVAYFWSGPNGFVDNSTASPSISNVTTAATGHYVVKVEGSNGCRDTASTNVVVNTLPAAPIITPAGAVAICQGSSITLASNTGANQTAFISPMAPTIEVSCDCPTGYVAVGYQGRVGAWMDQFQLACKQLNSNGTLGSTVVFTSPNGTSSGGGSQGPYTFAGNTVMVGATINMYSTFAISGITGFGQTTSYIAANGVNTSSPTTLTPMVSSLTSSTGTVYVPDGSVITGMVAYNTSYAQGVAFKYRSINSILNPTTLLWSTSATTSTINVNTAGAYTVTATDVNNCSATSAPTTVSINSLPVVYNVTGGGSYCADGAGMPVGLSNSENGATYQLKLNGTNTGSPVAGNGAAISFGNQTTGGTYTIVATYTSTSCSTNMSGSVQVIVNPLPTVYNITGGGNYCPGTTPPSIFLSGSQTGVNYELYINGVASGQVRPGTGGPLNFGAQSTSAGYTIMAVNTSTFCRKLMSGQMVIAPFTAPNVTLLGTADICRENITDLLFVGTAGATVTYTENGGNAQTAVLTTNGNVTVSVSPFFNTTYAIVSVMSTDGCVSTPTSSAVITVNTKPFPQITPNNLFGKVSGSNCSGIMTYIALVGGEPFPTQTYTFSGATTGSGSGNGTSSSFNRGVTLVQVTGTNMCGASSLTFNVTMRSPDIDLRGNGANIANADVTPSATDNTDFGTTTPGVLLTKTYKIFNTGDTTLGIYSIGASGNSFTPGNYTLPIFIEPGDSASFDVVFNETAIGVHTANIDMGTDDCDQFPYLYAVQAEVICVPATFTACPANVSESATIGRCNAPVNYAVTATGNPAPAITYTFSGATTGSGNGIGSGSLFNVGATTVVVTATNVCGTVTCRFDVNVTDNEFPVIACPANIPVGNDIGQCGAVVSYTAPVGTDNCPGSVTTQIAGRPSGSFFTVGTTTNTFEVTDASGNRTKCSFDVIVTDSERPTIACAANINVNNDMGRCGAVVNFTTPVGADNCPGALTTQIAGLASGSLFPIGTTTNTFEAKDARGLIATCSFDVIVRDNEFPVITCPANIPVGNDIGQCGAVVSYTTPVGTDNCSGSVTTQIAGRPSGSFFTVGTTTNTFEVTDASGNRTKCSFDVIVTDSERPTIACAANINVNNDMGRCGAVVNFTTPVGADNCPGALTTQIAGLASGSLFPIGTTINTFEVKDARGLIATCSFDVTVTDNERPVINCPVNITVNSATGICGAVVSYSAPVGTDNCTGAVTTQTAGLASGATFPVGITTNTFKVIDVYGLSTTCNFTVTVVDNVAPNAICQNATVYLDGSGNASISVPDINNGSSDNCGIQSLSVAPTAFNCSNLGSNTVTLTVKDNSTISSGQAVDQQNGPGNTLSGWGNVAQSFTAGTTGNLVALEIKASYNFSPTATLAIYQGAGTGGTLLSTQTVNIPNAGGNAMQVIQYTLPSPIALTAGNVYSYALLNSFGIILGVNTGGNTYAGGQVYNGGTNGSTPFDTWDFYFKTLMVTTGNSSTCTATVTVLDTTKPVVTCPANISVNTASGQCGATVSFAASATDNCGAGGLTYTYSQNPGTIFPVGTTTVSVTAKDASNNISAPCSFNVTVTDNEFPVIACPANIPVGNDIGQCGAVVSYTTPVGTDNCSGSVTTQIAGRPSGSFFTVGTTTNTFEVTDASGNRTKCSFDVIVTDSERPTIACAANINVNNDMGRCGAVVNFTAPVGTDNCLGATTTQTAGLASGATFPVGTTTNTFVVTDAYNNTNTCSFTVTVTDSENPVIACPANINVNNDAGICGAVVTYTAPVGTDNCTGATTAQTAGLASGATFPVGTTTNTFVVTDTYNNTNTCSFTITVNAAEINITGNGNSILNGDVTADAGDHTDFGGTNPSVPVTRTYTIENNGTHTLGVYSISITGNSFTASGYTLPIFVTPGNTSTFDVTFNEAVLGVHNAMIHLGTDDCDEHPYSYAIKGEITCAPASFTACPANININAASGMCSEVVNYTATTNGTPVPAITYTFSGATTGSGSGTGTGATFNVGVTTVTINAINPCSDVNCTFTVTVTDNQMPVLAGVPADATVSCDAIPGAATVTATDNCSGTLVVTFNEIITSGAMPTAGLKGAWTFNEGAGSTTADQSGNGNNGTKTSGVSWVAGQSGTAVQMPGNSNDYVQINNGTGGALDTRNAISMFAWYMPGTNGSQQNPIIQFNESNWGTHMWQTGSNQLFVRFTQRNTLSFTTNLAANTLIPGQWNCVGATYDSTTGIAKLWCNGVNVQSLNIGQMQLSTNHNVRIGSVNFDGRRTNSKVDNVVIYNRELTQAEISSLCAVSCPQNYTITRTWSTTDPSNNVTTATQKITVKDTTRPVLTVPADVALNNDAGLCTAVATYTATATDNCSNNVTITYSHNSGFAFPKGTTTVTVTAKDECQNTTVKTFNVTVTDNEAPAIACAANISVNNDAGICGAAVTYTTPVGTDNCSGSTTVQTAGLASGATFPVGTTTNTFVVTDASNNTNTCSFTVTVTDNEVPTISIAGVTVNADNGQCLATNVNLGTPTTADNCDVDTVWNDAPASYNVGNTTVTWNVKDIYGNTNSTTQTITVVDNQAPIVLTQNITVYLDANGAVSITAAQVNNVSSDNCGIATMVVSPSSFSCSSDGANTVTLTVTDIHNNTASNTATVTVVDTVKPVISCPANVTVSCLTTPANTGTATATDACGVQSITYTDASTYNSNPANAAYYNYTITRTWTAKDSNNNAICCTQVITVQQLKLTAAVTNVACHGGNSGSIDLTVQGGVGSLGYSWSNSATTQDVNGLPIGNYTVTVTDGAGCTATATYTITQPTPLAATAVTMSPNPTVSGQASNTIYLGYGAQSVTLSSTASGGTPGYTYSWSPTTGVASPTSATTSVSPTVTTTYTLTITDNKGCVKTVSKTIYVMDVRDGNKVKLCHNGNTISVSSNAVPAHLNHGDQLGQCFEVDGTTTKVSCYGGNNGSINATVYGGIAPYTYSWSNGATTEDISGLIAGNYTLTVTSANSATATATFTVQQYSKIVTNGSVTNVKCYGENTGKINLSVSGGNDPYFYSWSDGSTTSQDRSNLVAGTYIVTVKDDNNCIMKDTFVITQPSAPITITGVITHVKCNGDETGKIDITVTGGTGSYSYDWDDNSSNHNYHNGCNHYWNSHWCNHHHNNNWCNNNSQDMTNVDAGTYTVTVKDANGCEKTVTFAITEPAAIAATSTKTNVSCYGGNNGSIDLTVSGGKTPYTYQWSNSATTQDVSGLTAGNYTVVIKDSNNCSKTLSFTISQPSKIYTSGSVTNVKCHGENTGKINLSVSGGDYPYTYSWSDGPTSQDRTNLAAGTYIVTVKDDNNCTMKDTFVITQPSTPITITGAITHVKCNGDETGKIDITVTGGSGSYSYDWDDNSSNHNSHNSCHHYWNSHWCNHHNNNNWCNNNSQDMTNVDAGTYTVTVKDGNGCEKTVTFTITEPAAIAVAVAKTSPTCNGGNDGAIDITASGGTSPYTYKWNNNSTAEDRTGLLAGTYSVEVKDANGCKKTVSVTISQPASISASTQVTGVACNGGTNGGVNLTVSGGTQPYTYLWSNNATTQDIGGLTAGTYSVVIKDSNGCTVTKSATVSQPAVISITSVVTNASCNGDDDGEIDITVTGGTAPYTYKWDNNLTCSDRTGLSAGNYSLTVKDANGCTKTVIFTIAQPNAIVVTGTVVNPGCYNGSNGTITLAVSGGSTPYTYKWNNNSTSKDRTGLSAGTYSIKVKDANDCEKTVSFTLSAPAAIAASISVNPSPTVSGQASNTIYRGYGAQSVTLTAAISGGTSPYTVNWTPTSTITSNTNAVTATVSPTSTTTYTISITDANGCTKTVTKTIYVKDVRDGDKIELCHNGNTISVSPSSVAAHLAHGDQLGECNSYHKGGNKEPEDDLAVENAKAGQAERSIAEVGVVKEMKVHPNPNTGKFYVELPKEIAGGEASILDMSGKEIRKVRFNPYARLEFDLGDVAAGIYMVQVRNGNDIYRALVTISR